MAAQRIALALESSGPGGAENGLLQLASALRERGDDVVLVTLRHGWMTERAEAAGIPVWVEPQQRGLRPDWIVRFARRLRRERVSLLHTHEFTLNVYGGMAARLVGIPSVATVHSAQRVLDKRRRIWAYRVLRRLGVPIVAVSQSLREKLSIGWGIPEEALRVIHNGIPIPPRKSVPGPARIAARHGLGLPMSLKLAVCVGNLYPVKDHATLIRALVKLPEARVAIAGRGDQAAALEELALELGVAERVHLLGLRDDVSQLLAAADVFVHPSLSEGLPLAILEAMAAGLPVVATDVGGIPEAVEDGKTGLLVPAAAPDQLAAAILRILASPRHAASLGQAGRARAILEFSVGSMADQYRALYAECGLSAER